MSHRTSGLPAAVVIVAALASASTLQAGQVRQLTDSKDVSFDWAMPIGNGSEIIVASSTNQYAGGGNPDHVFQLASFNPTTGLATQLSTFSSSLTHVRHNVSVSDDGQWIAFISHGDLIPGQNGNRNPEAFVMNRNGTQLAQLTNDASPDAGTVSRLGMAGSGNRITFASNSNLTGGNPQRVQQVFVVNRDGTGLTQMTNAASGVVDHLWISDDGNRLAFSHSGDLTGGNPDKNIEVYTMTVGDAAPRQITSSTIGNSTGANISGDGSTIVWESTANPTGGNADGGLEIFVADWTTPTIRQLTNSIGGMGRASRQPWPTTNGQQIFFATNQSPVTIPLVYEVFKINLDGTGKTRLTTLNQEAEHPVVSGDGTRFAAWFEGGLYAASGTGTGLLQLIVRRVPDQGYPDMGADGKRICFNSHANPLGTDADGSGEIFTVKTDGTALTQITNFTTTAGGGRPAISGDGSRVYYESAANPFGTNADGNDEVFGVNADGTGLIQYTTCTGSSSLFSGYPEVSDDGNVIIFTSLCNLTGGNADATGELFKISPNGSGLTQITSFPSVAGLTTYVYWPRVDATGTWVTMSGNANLGGGNPENNFEVWRMKTDGTNLLQITTQAVYDSFGPDISGDGSRVAFQSEADLTGENADHNTEIFLYRVGGSPQMQQLTHTTGVVSNRPRLSRDGRYVFFHSPAKLLGDENDTGRTWLYRYDLDTDTIERAGGLDFEATVTDYWPAVNNDGSVVAYSSQGDPAGHNPDDYWELFVADRNTPNPPVISPGPAPTTVRFEPEPGILRYDIIRGDVANLKLGGITGNLGAVQCVENDSGDTTTAGFEDQSTPAPGQAFFYLFRGSMSIVSGPGSYGTISTGADRLPSSGDCTP